MREEILTAIQQMIQAILGASVVIGSVPPLEGYAVSFVGGNPQSTFFDLNSDQRLPVLFNGKSADQQTLATGMDAVHMALTTSKTLPFSDSWQIYAIETTSAPNLIGREENQNWIYGSSFLIKFYAKGVNNG